MSLQPTPTEVGTMYDQYTSLLTDVMAGFIHVGYWDDPEREDTVEVATERLTREIGERLSSVRGQRILDVGCGTGKSAVQIATAHDVHITGITVSNHQIELAQSQYESNTKAGQVNFLFANAMDLPFADASFDGAYAIESLVHMDDRRTALTNIARVLHPGSRLAIADLFLDAGCPNPEVLARFYELFQVPPMPSGDDLKDLLRQTGFKVIEFTDIRDNVRPICKFIEQKALSLEGEIREKLLEIAHSMATLKELGYAFITAERI
ncbi:S-adenosyl-L-methionine-dependent methyltransferase [Aspergillus bertholletiae]|uniref:S-adenosyl-L-methionine-dependent methyltransferase n=1 Tax=Aspergillus bertholletiae TaxID=1226010 RepID=A0A5N7BGU7_9EURO|nr:S-adenosyl-L-methionine-dependent methyltransferase [Aspergillus bertholletiae]